MFPSHIKMRTEIITTRRGIVTYSYRDGAIASVVKSRQFRSWRDLQRRAGAA